MIQHTTTTPWDSKAPERISLSPPSRRWEANLPKSASWLNKVAGFFCHVKRHYHMRRRGNLSIFLLMQAFQIIPYMINIYGWVISVSFQEIISFSKAAILWNENPRLLTASLETGTGSVAHEGLFPALTLWKWWQWMWLAETAHSLCITTSSSI